MIALCLPVAWRRADRRIHLARLVLSIVGVGMILYLVIAEFFVIKAICLWCSGGARRHLHPFRDHRDRLPGGPGTRVRSG